MGTAKKNTNDFVLLISGIADNDRLVRQYIDSDRPIYYKSRYTAPYEEFHELKKLLLLVRSIDDVNAENVIAVDLGEWIGHEQEEYLTVMLKYLHDQRDHWRYVFTAGDCSREEAARLYIRLKTYLSGTVAEDETFRSPEHLESYLFRTQRMQRNAARTLARLFFSREMKDSRGYEILESVLKEMEQLNGGKRINLATLREYVSREDSLLCLLMGKTVEIKEDKYENY